MHRPKRWNIAPPHALAEDLAARLKISPLIAQILLVRGIEEFGACESFLRPSLASLHPPASLAGVTGASDRIARAIRDRQKMVIYGDYDVDGITATTILWHAIRVLGGRADYYVPHRIEEGYGLNAQAIAEICDGGANLIVTVDCGITAIEPARIARDRGVDLIITDHHEWQEKAPDPASGALESGAIGLGATELNVMGLGGIELGAMGRGTPLPVVSSVEKPRGGEYTTPWHPTENQPALKQACFPNLPEAHTLVHPRLPTGGAPYANPHLCGAGVAFKLAWGIGQAMNGGVKVSEAFRNFLIDATALAALGTIADVVPLVGENRALAHFGLGGLKASKLIGIKALIASAGLTGQNLSSFDVGFKLGPRLNACGRMGHARLAVEMLTTADEAKAAEIATYLEQQNRARQTMEKGIVEQATAQAIELGFDKDDRRAMVVGQADWHPGVIGIVASRMVDKFHRPAIVIALSNGHGQGSGRSIAGFHLAKALSACGEHLEAHGGHEMAAGLRLKTENFENFRHAFCEVANSRLTPADLVPQLRLDAEARIPHLTEALVRDLERLGPFGNANPRPLICLRGMQITHPPRRVGKTGDHLQLQMKQGNRIIKGIGFGFGKLEPELAAGTVIDVVGEPTINEYNGRVNVEVQLKDLQVAGGE